MDRRALLLPLLTLSLGAHGAGRLPLADCDRAFFPGLTPASSAYAADRRYYDPADVSTVRRADTLVHQLQHTSGTYTSIATRSVSGCNRLILKAPREIEIGLASTTVIRNNFETDARVAPGPIQIPARTPASARLMIYAYENARPAIGREVRLWADFRGAPPDGLGRTVAHEHLYTSRGAPSLRFAEYEGDEGESAKRIRRGTERVYPATRPLIVTTSDLGQASIALVAQYRGGVEQVAASASLGGTTVTGATSVILTVLPRLVHFGEYFNRREGYKPTREFPFLLVGQTRGVHMYNHFIHGGVGSRIASTFLAIWEKDRKRIETEAKHPERRWIQLNDMSLEYGGQFKVNASGYNGDLCNSPGNAGSHNGHQTGVDFDVSPCYTSSVGGHTSSATCWAVRNRRGTPEVPMIDFALLEQYVLGRARGVILVHNEAGDDRYHYHIRFPDNVR